MIRSLTLAAVVGVGLTAMPASASYRDADVRTTVVHIGDLDLASGWGVDHTIARLRNAIDGLCDEDEHCRDEAWLSADWQVARNMAAAQWRRRIAEERAADRLRYRWRDDGPPMPGDHDGWTVYAPVADAPPPPPPPAPIAKVTTKTTTTITTTTTTTITLAYRAPPPDYGWYPH